MNSYTTWILDAISYVQPPLEQDFYRYGFGMGLAGTQFGYSLFTSLVNFIAAIFLFSANPLPKAVLGAGWETETLTATSASAEQQILDMANEFLAIVPEPIIKHGMLGAPLVAQSLTWNEIQYLFAYYLTFFASQGYVLLSSLMYIGGSLQNPLIILFNYMSPTTYKSFALTSTIALAVHGTSATLILASLGKIVLAFVVVVFANQQILNTDFMSHYLVSFIFGSWIPQFMTLVVPALGTSSYFLSFM